MRIAPPGLGSSLFILTLGVLVPVTAASRTIYVDASPGGDCAGSYSPTARSCSGASGLDSYDRIQEAADEVDAGDVILVREGTYHGNVGMKASGNQDWPILFQGYQDEVATVDCSSDCSGQFAVYWKGNNQPHEWIIWDNIDVKAVRTKYAIWIEGHHNVVQNSEFSHANNGQEMVGATCVTVMRGDDTQVLNNDVHTCGWNGISISDTNRSLVQGNYSHHNPHHNCIQFFHNPREGVTTVYEGNAGRYNRLHDCRHGFYMRYQRDLELMGNVIYSTTRAGFNFTWASETAGAERTYRSDSRVYNNTVLGGHAQAESWERGILLDAASHVDIRNNIFGAHQGYEVDVDPLVDQGHTIDNNLYFGEFRARFSGVLYTEVDAWRTASSQIGPDERAGDPRFADQATHDYTLRSGSAAIDTGAVLGADHRTILHPTSRWPDQIVTAAQDPLEEGWEIGAYFYPNDDVAPHPPAGLTLLASVP